MSSHDTPVRRDGARAADVHNSDSKVARRRVAGAVVGVAAGAAAIGAAAAANAQNDPPAAKPPTVSIPDSSVRYGEALRVNGRLAANQSAENVALQYRGAGADWRTVKTGPVDDRGRFRLTARLRHSGQVRVTAAVADAANAESQSAAVSQARGVTVAAKIGKRGGTKLDVLAGSTAQVRGTVWPSTSRRKVTLEERTGKRWKRIATTWTDRRGRFTLRHRSGGVDTFAVRVKFAGDARNRGTTKVVGRMSFYRSSGASWYSLYGSGTACGQTLGYSTLGVAHKTLPCGTKVRLKYGSRIVTARVIDRGPFVAGREWDLTGATKRALGFGDVGNVWAAW